MAGARFLTVASCRQRIICMTQKTNSLFKNAPLSNSYEYFLCPNNTIVCNVRKSEFSTLSKQWKKLFRSEERNKKAEKNLSLEQKLKTNMSEKLRSLVISPVADRKLPVKAEDKSLWRKFLKNQHQEFKKSPVFQSFSQEKHAFKLTLTANKDNSVEIPKQGEEKKSGGLMAECVKVYERFTPQIVQDKVTDLNNGINQEFTNVKNVWNLSSHQRAGTLAKNSTYEQMLSFNDLTRDKYKTSCVMVCSLLPGGFFILSIPVLLLPRQCMPPGFWSKDQKRPFLKINHSYRKPYMEQIVNHLQKMNMPHRHSIDDTDKRIFNAQCATWLDKTQPINNSTLIGFKHSFRVPPINMEYSKNELRKAFCRVFDVSTGGDTITTLLYQAAMIKELDNKLLELDLNKLSEDQVLAACYMRGLDAGSFSHGANLYWLHHWLQLSKQCEQQDAWFMLHAMILSSMNYREKL